jgi:hypothetical protein
MRHANLARRTANAAASRILPLAALLAFAGGANAQNVDDYILGLDNRLQMKVHILGEVQAPGEYSVPDDTNILELLSKAGGPTEFANLGSVSLKREEGQPTFFANSDPEDRVMKINLDNYLRSSDTEPLPMLQPGDVVTVSRNSMHKWKTVFGIARDISVVATAYFLYVRTFENK